MAKGTIKTLKEKGFGFIEADGYKKDLFFHASEVKNSEFSDLEVGMNVSFDVKEGKKGAAAANVMVESYR